MTKIIVLVFTVLAVATVIYGAESDVQKFKKLYAECAENLGVPNEVRLDVAVCAAFNDGDILYSNGEYKKDVAISKINSFISDPIKLKEALDIFNKCDKQAVESGITGIGKMLKLAACALPILNLFDK